MLQIYHEINTYEAHVRYIFFLNALLLRLSPALWQSQLAYGLRITDILKFCGENSKALNANEFSIK
jgi:hypothetical protein